MLWWERVAPLGKPVVPEVYWMLTGSCGDSSFAQTASFSRGTPAPAASRPSQVGSSM